MDGWSRDEVSLAVVRRVLRSLHGRPVGLLQAGGGATKDVALKLRRII
jgi:hypothetical protein